MPELPEVETVVNELRSSISGHKILDVNSNWPNQIKNSSAEDLKKEISGTVIESIKRYGKYIIISLSGEKNLIIHLKMTGSLLISLCGDKQNCRKDELGKLNKKHIHFSLFLDKGKTIYLYDIRKFASIRLINSVETFKFFKKILGLDALSKELTPKYLSEKLKKSNLSIKRALLNQKIIAGIGNIYADEILFASKINPLKISKRLTLREINNIYKNMNIILKESIKKGGTTFSDFQNTRGEKGNYFKKLKVYKREICSNCHERIKRIKINERSTFYCPNCQKGKNK